MPTGGGGGGDELPPPQATMNPSSPSPMHKLAIAECLDIFRPATSITMPAMGSVNGSQGERLSARRGIVDPGPEFGPVLVMVKVTV